MDQLGVTILVGSVLLGVGWTPSFAANIPIPNYSFELPDIVFASGGPITNWTKIEFDPPQVGIFDNPADGQLDHIHTGGNGGQVAFVFSVAGVGLFQDLTATYQVGNDYHLTIAIGGVGGAPLAYTEGDTLELRLYYRDELSNKIYIAVTPIVYTAAWAAADPITDGTSINILYDYTASLPTVQAGDAWAGKAIGIEMYNTVGIGGYWDIDNVRLTEAPEPSSLLLMTLGGAAGLGFMRRRACRERA
jgi:hypothetical protein